METKLFASLPSGFNNFFFLKKIVIHGLLEEILAGGHVGCANAAHEANPLRCKARWFILWVQLLHEMHVRLVVTCVPFMRRGVRCWRLRNRARDSLPSLVPLRCQLCQVKVLQLWYCSFVPPVLLITNGALVIFCKVTRLRFVGFVIGDGNGKVSEECVTSCVNDCNVKFAGDAY